MALDFDHHDMRPERAGHHELKAFRNTARGLAMIGLLEVDLGTGTLRSNLMSKVVMRFL